MTLKYVTVDEFKTYPSGIKITIGPDKCFVDETAVGLYLEVVESLVEQFIGRSLVYQEYTENFIGNNSDLYFPINKPIDTITSLKEYTLYGNTLTEIELDSYNNTEYSVYYYYEYNNDSKYELVYKAGYSTIPLDFKHAIYMQATRMLERDAAGIISSESYMNQKNAYREPDPSSGLYPEVMMLLRPYKNYIYTQ